MHYFVPEFVLVQESKTKKPPKKTDNIVPTICKERNYVKAPKSVKSAAKAHTVKLWMENLANFQLHDMNNVCCGWIWIEANRCQNAKVVHIDKMPSCITDIVVHFIVRGRHFLWGWLQHIFSSLHSTFLVYLSMMKECFGLLAHFLCDAFHCAILLHHLLIIVLNYVNFSIHWKWAPIHRHTHIHTLCTVLNLWRHSARSHI